MLVYTLQSTQPRESRGPASAAWKMHDSRLYDAESRNGQQGNARVRQSLWCPNTWKPDKPKFCSFEWKNMKWLDGFCWKKSIQPFLEALKVGLKKEILITCHPTHPYDRQIRQTKGNHWIQWISWEVVQNFINRFWYYTVAMLPLCLSNSKLSTGWESDFPQPSMTRKIL